MGGIFIQTDELFRRYESLVYRYLMTLCQDESLAEELTQETFYQAVKSAERYDGTCKVSTWLCQIGKHMWQRELRRRKRSEALRSAIDGHIVSSVKTPEDQISDREAVLDIMKRIHALAETEKEVVLLRISTDLSFREIGEILGKSESWARVTFFRAKQKLREEHSE